MSKTSNHAKLQVLKAWLETINVKKKVKKQPEWLKEELEEGEKLASK